jgi:hypothetical protein
VSLGLGHGSSVSFRSAVRLVLAVLL